MAQLHVTLIACVAGNPLKGWRGGTDPDDEWQDQDHPFDSLEDAKAFIAGLPNQTTTHVVLLDGDTILYVKDAGDDLDAAEPGVVPASQEPDDTGPDGGIQPAPPLLARQETSE